MPTQREMSSAFWQVLPRPTSLSHRHYVTKWFISQNTHWKGSVTKAGRGNTQGCGLGSSASYKARWWSGGYGYWLGERWTPGYRLRSRATMKITEPSVHSSSEEAQHRPRFNSKNSRELAPTRNNVLGAQLQSYGAKGAAKEIQTPE